MFYAAESVIEGINCIYNREMKPCLLYAIKFVHLNYKIKRKKVLAGELKNLCRHDDLFHLSVNEFARLARL